MQQRTSEETIAGRKALGVTDAEIAELLAQEAACPDSRALNTCIPSWVQPASNSMAKVNGRSGPTERPSDGPGAKSILGSTKRAVKLWRRC